MKINTILAPSDMVFTLLGSIQLLTWHYFIYFLCHHTIQQAIVYQKVYITDVVQQKKALPDILCLKTITIDCEQLNNETQQKIKNIGLDFVCSAIIWLSLPVIYAVLFICLNEAANLTKHKMRSLLLLTLLYSGYTMFNLYQQLYSESFKLEKWWVWVLEVISIMALLILIALQSQNHNIKKLSTF